MIKLLLRSKKTFDIAKKSAMKRATKEKALYLVMTDEEKKHYILKMPECLTVIRFVDVRKRRLNDTHAINKGEGAVLEKAAKKKKVKNGKSK